MTCPFVGCAPICVCALGPYFSIIFCLLFGRVFVVIVCRIWLAPPHHMDLDGQSPRKIVYFGSNIKKKIVFRFRKREKERERTRMRSISSCFGPKNKSNFYLENWAHFFSV